MGKILHESLTDGTQLLLLGAMVIGLVTGDAGKAAMQPFSNDLFKGHALPVSAGHGPFHSAQPACRAQTQSPWLLAYAVLGPLVHAGLALALAWLAQVPAGDAALLMVLAASARLTSPCPPWCATPFLRADPSLYVSLSLG